VALCVTGSIAAVETIRLSRELRRHGADVHAFLTPGAERFVTPLSLQWATTHPVKTELSGMAEHIGSADIVLVAPATLHTVNKVAQGLADNIVTTLIASAWGNKTPIVFVPTMHGSLFRNPVFQKNMNDLKIQKNMRFLDPVKEEGKAKFLDAEEIIPRVARFLALCHPEERRSRDEGSQLVGKNILLTAGPTQGPIDAVRFMSNTSTGELGLGMAKALYMKGANPTVVYGPGQKVPDRFYTVIPVKTPRQMLKGVVEELKTKSYDAAIFVAAVLDHVPVTVGDKKLSSTKPLQIEYVQSPKIIREVDAVCRLYKVGFKLVWKKTEDEMVRAGMEALENMNAQLVVVNDLSRVGEESHPAMVLDRHGNKDRVTTKREIIDTLVQKLEHAL